jgi:hypothetical protein
MTRIDDDSPLPIEVENALDRLLSAWAEQQQPAPQVAEAVRRRAFQRARVPFLLSPAWWKLVHAPAGQAVRRATDFRHTLSFAA